MQRVAELVQDPRPVEEKQQLVLQVMLHPVLRHTSSSSSGIIPLRTCASSALLVCFQCCNSLPVVVMARGLITYCVTLSAVGS